MQDIVSINATEGGKYHCTVLTNSRGAHLQGSFCIVPLNNGYFRADVLCRAGIVNTHNQAHENAQFQLLIAKRGRLDHISAVADVEQITLEPLAFFDLESQRLVGSKGNPQSGTIAHIPAVGELDKFRREQRFHFHAGYMPGHPEVLISLINRDFGPIEDTNGNDLGGFGEARHRIYAGKNGSGKTVFAFEAICARACRHSRLGVLLLDTKGDIVVEGRHIKPGFQFDPHRLLRDAGRLYEIIRIRDIRLTEPDHMIRHLGKSWRKMLGKTRDIVEMILQQAVQNLMDAHNLREVDLRHITLDAVRTQFVALVRAGLGWAAAPGSNERERLADQFEVQTAGHAFLRDWQDNIEPIYTGRFTVGEIVQQVLRQSQIRMVNLHGVAEDHQTAVVVEMLKSIKREGADNYFAGRVTNAEVFLDEAPRWAPQDRGDNPYADIIIDAINTTRAYGIAWTFCTQRLTAIDKNILAQCHTRYYCKGLGVGADSKHMEDDLGTEGLAYYRMLNLENSYFAVVSGEELNFGSGGHFMAFVGWAGNVNDRFKEHNTHIWRPTLVQAESRS